jgi:SulP family sulfate permease
MASGLLAGVNPIYGLYACIAGPIAGGLTSSTQRMIVATTSAAALGAGEALSGVPEDRRTDALFLMVVLMGVLQVVFGVLHLGRLTRFVSYSVMTGFVTGIAVRTVLTQLPTITGYDPAGANEVSKGFDLVTHAAQVDLRILAVAIAALVLTVVLARTPVGSLSTLVGIVLPSAAIVLLVHLDTKKLGRIGDGPGHRATGDRRSRNRGIGWEVLHVRDRRREPPGLRRAVARREGPDHRRLPGPRRPLVPGPRDHGRPAALR